MTDKVEPLTGEEIEGFKRRSNDFSAGFFSTSDVDRLLATIDALTAEIDALIRERDYYREMDTSATATINALREEAEVHRAGLSRLGAAMNKHDKKFREMFGGSNAK